MKKIKLVLVWMSLLFVFLVNMYGVEHEGMVSYGYMTANYDDDRDGGKDKKSVDRYEERVSSVVGDLRNDYERQIASLRKELAEKIYELEKKEKELHQMQILLNQKEILLVRYQQLYVQAQKQCATRAAIKTTMETTKPLKKN